jgi:hypothetical protein
MRTAIPVLALVLMLQGCAVKVNTPTPPTVKQQVVAVANQIDKYTNAIAKACMTATQDILQQYPNPTPDQLVILDIIMKITQYNEIARNTTEALLTNDLTTPAGIRNALIPIFKKARVDIDNGLLGIKNIEAKKKATDIANIIEISLNAVTLFLEAIQVNQSSIPANLEAAYAGQ